jgi:hypothetical protein
MKHRIQGIIIGLIVASILFGGTALALAGTHTINATYRNIRIIIDGVLITPRDVNGNVVHPFISQGTTYLPVRAVGEAFGKPVEWDGSTNTVYIGQRPGSVQYMFDVVPAYQREGDYVEFSSTKPGSFNMAGHRYLHGCTWSGGYSLYNLNGQFNRVRGTIGHVDGSSSRNAHILNIYTDGKLYSRIELKPDMMPQEITIEVTGVLQLKMEIEFWNRTDTVYGFGNVIIE